MRHQLPVHSPIAVRALASGALAALHLAPAGSDELVAALKVRHGASQAVLVDSGTSALVVAFRLLRAQGIKRVACPGYVCVNVGAAALSAGSDVMLYDSDPSTLSPDIASLSRILRNGAQAVLIAHLYGYPVNMSEVTALCAASGVPIIEDAAQEAGATVDGRRLGSLGNLGVLSFGRGKGVAGGGGALLLPTAFAAPMLGGSGAGLSALVDAAGQWLLGRPAFYSIPASLPFLHLGEMVYRVADEPRRIPRASIAMVLGSMANENPGLATRRAHAAVLQEMTANSRVRSILSPPGAAPSYLRFPVIVGKSGAKALPRAGIVGGYPRLLDEQVELRGTVTRGSETLAGAHELRDRLFTLPTHSLLNKADLVMLEGWLRDVG